MVVILSEWWLFYLSGDRGRPPPTTVGISLNLQVIHAGNLWMAPRFRQWIPESVAVPKKLSHAGGLITHS